MLRVYAHAVVLWEFNYSACHTCFHAPISVRDCKNQITNLLWCTTCADTCCGVRFCVIVAHGFCVRSLVYALLPSKEIISHGWCTWSSGLFALMLHSIVSIVAQEMLFSVYMYIQQVVVIPGVFYYRLNTQIYYSEWFVFWGLLMKFCKLCFAYRGILNNGLTFVERKIFSLLYYKNNKTLR